MNNLVWGSMIALASVVLAAATGATPLGFFTGFEPVSAFGPADVIASALLLLAVVEALVGSSNAMPIPKLDGGYYAHSLLKERFGVADLEWSI